MWIMHNLEPAATVRVRGLSASLPGIPTSRVDGQHRSVDGECLLSFAPGQHGRTGMMMREHLQLDASDLHQVEILGVVTRYGFLRRNPDTVDRLFLIVPAGLSGRRCRKKKPCIKSSRSTQGRNKPIHKVNSIDCESQALLPADIQHAHFSIVQRVSIICKSVTIYCIELEQAAICIVRKQQTGFFESLTNTCNPVAAPLCTQCSALCQLCGNRTGSIFVVFVQMVIAVDPATNSLVVVGSPRAVARVADLASQLVGQLPAAPGQVRYIGLPDTLQASTTARLVQQSISAMTPPGGRRGDLRRRVAVIADQANNALIVTCNEYDFEIVGDLIAALSQPAMVEQMVVKVYALKTITAAVDRSKKRAAPSCRALESHRTRH